MSLLSASYEDIAVSFVLLTSPVHIGTSAYFEFGMDVMADGTCLASLILAVSAVVSLMYIVYLD